MLLVFWPARLAMRLSAPTTLRAPSTTTRQAIVCIFHMVVSDIFPKAALKNGGPQPALRADLASLYVRLRQFDKAERVCKAARFSMALLMLL